MTAILDETWSRIRAANEAAGWAGWGVAERDQIEALAEDLNRELLATPRQYSLSAGQLHTREVRMRAKEIGWTYVSSDSCPRRLVGKSCKGIRCWCRSNTVESAGNLNDHGATWFCEWHWGPHHQKFVLWEPYAARGDYVAGIVRLAEADGLVVRITASVWNPPHSVGIMFHEKDPRSKCNCTTCTT